MSIYDHFSQTELDILQARAERIARVTDDAQTDDVITGLTVNLGNELYVMPIDSLVGIHKEVAITPVPCVPTHVTGVANVRGHVIPVLDLAALLHVPGNEVERGSIVVAAEGNISVACQVETIGEVRNFESSELTPMPNAGEHAYSPYLRGILAGKYTLIDIEAIIHDPTLVIDEAVT